jgi:hypothetical protein
MFYKEIICLANSRKMKGRCVTGKDANGREWTRPVSSREYEELSLDEIRPKGRRSLGLLDIVKIPCKAKKPSRHQPENILIDTGSWEKVGEFEPKHLDSICDNPKSIWLIGEHEDRIPVEYFDKIKSHSSLFLIKIKPSDLLLKRVDYTDINNTLKRKLRAVFLYNGKQYNFGVTDPLVENQYKNKPEGDHRIFCNKIYLCIRLGEPWYRDNCCYKFVAAMIKV